MVGKKCVDRQPRSQTFFGAVLPSLTGKMGSAAELLIPLSSSWAIEDFYKQQFKQVKTSNDHSAVQSSLTPHHIPQCSDGAQLPLQTTVQSPLIPHHIPECSDGPHSAVSSNSTSHPRVQWWWPVARYHQMAQCPH